MLPTARAPQTQQRLRAMSSALVDKILSSKQLCIVVFLTVKRGFDSDRVLRYSLANPHNSLSATDIAALVWNHPIQPLRLSLSFCHILTLATRR